MERFYNALDAMRWLLAIPMWQKWMGLFVTIVVLIAAYAFSAWLPLQKEIEDQANRVETERLLLIKNQRIARDLPRMKKEFDLLQKQLRVALSMLPKRSQIPDLLENVSWAGKDAGLDFSVFRPMQEVEEKFYATVPVELEMTGTYHQLLSFLKRVGEMPRIVSIEGLHIRRLDVEGKLSIRGRAVTYRFIETDRKRPQERTEG